MPIILSDKVNEQSTKRLRWQCRYGGLPVGISRIDSAVMTITVLGTTRVINDRLLVNVKSYFDSQGNFDFLLTERDNIIVSTAAGLAEEIHVITFKIVTNDTPVLRFNEELQLTVVNLQMIGGDATITPAPARMVMRGIDPTVVIG